MILTSPKKARKFFDDKMKFTTGPVELKRMIDINENTNIVDVRSSEDFAQGHISGAVNLPKQNWDTSAGLKVDVVNVIYCYSEVCHLAAAAAREFADQGFSVMELEGGFDEWQHYNMPIET
jgi:rhodanese-related sulfurtransferase